MNKLLKRLNSNGEKDPSTTDAVKMEVITFPDSSQATVVLPTSADKADDIITALDLKPYKAVFLNLGNSNDFDRAVSPRLTQLYSRGIALAALDTEALIIDGGKQTGVAALMGKGVADRGNKSILIGLGSTKDLAFKGGQAAGSLLETNHSHFVLIEGDVPERNSIIINSVVTQLINGPGMRQNQTIDRKVPSLAIVTGGDTSTIEQVLHAVRQQMSIIIVEGSGGLADEVAAACQVKDRLPEDPAMAEIVADGKLFFHSLSKAATDIQILISSALGVDKVLVQAWETFADYDLNANKQQKRFDKLQQAIILIGVFGTALAILQEVLKTGKGGNPFIAFTSTATYVILLIVPITLTILVTIANRFKQGNKWLLLRAAAEAIKREIFRYRTRTNDYASTPEQQLTKKIEDITTRTMRTEVNSSYLLPYDKKMGFPPYMYGAQGGDDGFSKLSPGRYITVRLGDQLNYFRKRSIRLGKQLSILSIAIFIIGGIGTFLAAINQPVWIALTTTIVAALGTYLGYRQTENTLTKYNQTATNLTNIKSWWNALSPVEQMLPENINTLVEHTEQVLQVELDGWIQQMQNALAELRKNQETKPEVNENRPEEDADNENPARPIENENKAVVPNVEIPVAVENDAVVPVETPVTEAAANGAAPPEENVAAPAEIPSGEPEPDTVVENNTQPTLELQEEKKK